MWRFSVLVFFFFFFFSSRRRHTRLQGDWSSDVCSSDVGTAFLFRRVHALGGRRCRAMSGIPLVLSLQLAGCETRRLPRPEALPPAESPRDASPWRPAPATLGCRLPELHHAAYRSFPSRMMVDGNEALKCNLFSNSVLVQTRMSFARPTPHKAR